MISINTDNHCSCIIFEEFTICAAQVRAKYIVGQKQYQRIREMAKEGGRVTFTSKDFLRGNAKKSGSNPF